MSIIDIRKPSLVKQGAKRLDGWGVTVPNHVTLPSYFRWKGSADRLTAAVLLVPAIPVIGLLMLLVRLTSRGPSLHRQLRVGRNGRWFLMYKIRTMNENAEANSGPVWTKPGDPRITHFGRVLRKFHLDEFPQLFNVLKGEMSLIGPRPERPEFVKVLADTVDSYSKRLVVSPGITGLAQINLPPDTDLDSVRKKLTLDIKYLQEASILLDARILVCTSLRLLGFSGEMVMRICRLRYEIPNPPLRTIRGNGSSDAANVTVRPVGILVQLSSKRNGTITKPKKQDDHSRASAHDAPHSEELFAISRSDEALNE